MDLYTYTDQDGYEQAFADVAEGLRLNGKTVAVEYRHMRVLELRQLEAVVPNACFVALEDALPELRLAKDRHELDAMRGAIEITERALHSLISQPLGGLTERQVASRLSQLMVDGGADGIAFVIVVAGPNSADPHKEPSDRPIQTGDLVTIDCGAVWQGYPADITRTFAVGEIADELLVVYQTVLKANAAGKAAVKPGVAAQDVDRAARQAIRDAGYGTYFFHRTGHGLGIEVHEPPYIVEGNEQLLAPGMVFTVEPGVYIPGLGGVRIEDNVVVTQEGVDCLTTFPRELMVLE
jgi:Xaa-Pro dipeptidase